MRGKRLTRQEAKLRTRAMLIDAAEAVFLREGFAHTSVEQISEEAGFSRGAFYSNFAHKDELALVLIEKRLGQLACAVDAFQRITDPARRSAAILDWFSNQADWIALRIEFSRRAVENPLLKEKLIELCRQEIQTIAQSFAANGRLPSAKTLELLAALHGLGAMGFHAAADPNQIAGSAARTSLDWICND